MWLQQFYATPHDQPVRWRGADDLSPALLLISFPYDPESRYGKKRETEWTGDKVHVTETCDDATPNLITDVTTTPATTSDFAMLPTIQAHLATRQMTPGEQLVDAGYVTSDHLLTSRAEHGIDLIGPVAADQSWQGQAGNGFAAARFVIDWEAKTRSARKGSGASCAWSAQQGVTISPRDGAPRAPPLGWVWKRAQLIAKDNNSGRAEHLARIRWAWERHHPWEALVFADGLDIHLLPKVGATWMQKGTQVPVMTPGQNAKYYLAGALDVTTGTLWNCLGARKTNALFRELLALLEARYPAPQYRRLYIVVDHCNIHKAKAAEQWLATHSRIQLLFLPPYCPRADPIEERPTDYT